MNRSKILVRLFLVVLGIAFATSLWAFPDYARQTKAACASCHVNPAGGADLSDAGKAFKADNSKAPEAAAKAAEYVGMNKCRMCHMKQAKAWTETAHSKAWAGLVKADPKKAAEMAAALKVELKDAPSATEACIKCHVAGFHLAGGFPQADSTKAAAVSNVTCESCHGPGSLHVAAAMADKKKTINKAVTAALCTQCHTAATSPAFKFEEFVKRGTHQVAQ